MYVLSSVELQVFYQVSHFIYLLSHFTYYTPTGNWKLIDAELNGFQVIYSFRCGKYVARLCIRLLHQSKSIKHFKIWKQGNQKRQSILTTTKKQIKNLRIGEFRKGYLKKNIPFKSYYHSLLNKVAKSSSYAGKKHVQG